MSTTRKENRPLILADQRASMTTHTSECVDSTPGPELSEANEKGLLALLGAAAGRVVGRSPSLDGDDCADDDSHDLKVAVAVVGPDCLVLRVVALGLKGDGAVVLADEPPHGDLVVDPHDDDVARVGCSRVLGWRRGHLASSLSGSTCHP